ncbi:MAG: hypothetical protein K9J17_09780 [Flavobacteriales bacterium]|nr:hypothetical protein [Flavobacteriales bacterium]
MAEKEKLTETVSNLLTTLKDRATTWAWPLLIALFMLLYDEEIRFRLRYSNIEYGDFKLTQGTYEAISDFELEWKRFLVQHGDSASQEELKTFITTALSQFELSKEEVEAKATASAAEVNKAVDVKHSVQSYEMAGFEAIITDNHAEAVRAFDEAYELSPTYHNVDEIRRLLKTKGVINDDVIKTILTDYTWGMPSSIVLRLKNKIRKTEI